MNDLRDELSALADEVRPAELLDRVYGTSRSLRRRRQALAAGSAVLAGVLAVGLLLPGGHEKKTPPLTPTQAPVPTPTLGKPKKFVPPVTESRGRKHMSLTLPNGTKVALSYPISENFEQAGVEAFWSFDVDECCPSATGWIPPGAQFKGYVRDGAGVPLEVWQASPSDFYAEADEDKAEDEVWFRYEKWFFHGGLADPQAQGEDLSAYYPAARKLRFEQTPDGMLKVISASGRKFDPPFDSLHADVLLGPRLAFRQGNDFEVQVTPTNGCDGPTEAPIMEWRGRQICKDGIMIRISADRGKTWQNWVRDLEATLRIDKVTKP